jgi:hypothetical protein
VREGEPHGGGGSPQAVDSLYYEEKDKILAKASEKTREKFHRCRLFLLFFSFDLPRQVLVIVYARRLVVTSTRAVSTGSRLVAMSDKVVAHQVTTVGGSDLLGWVAPVLTTVVAVWSASGRGSAGLTHRRHAVFVLVPITSWAIVDGSPVGQSQMRLNKCVNIESKKDLLLILDPRVLRVRSEAVLRLSNHEIIDVGLDVLVKVCRSLVLLYNLLLISGSVNV